jgi:hypothetical protein
MKRLTLILTMIGIITNVYSQSTLLWSKDFTTELLDNYSENPTIHIDADTIVVIGRKNTPGGQRLLIVKYNLKGDTISTRSYGNDSVSNNTLEDYKFDSTNHVYLLHTERIEFYKSKIVLQKYSLHGDLIWNEEIKDIADTSYNAGSLGLASDTCLFLSGFKEYNYPKSYDPDIDVIQTISIANLFAINSDGKQLWHREFNPDTEINWFNYDVFVHNNTAFLFADNSSYYNCLVKVDINNNLTINTNTGLINGINNVQLSPDNNLLITPMWEYRMFKANLNGSVIWTEYYGTNLPSYIFGDEITSTIQDSAGNIYVTGRHYGDEYLTPNYTNADILTIKYDSKGKLIWQNRYEYGVNNADIGSFITLKNGNVYVGGESQRLGIETDWDYIVLKIDSATGDSNGVYRYNGVTNGADAISSLSVFDNGNVALTGSRSINGYYDWTTQLLSDVILGVQNLISYPNLEVYPNPITSGSILMVKGNGFNEYSIISSIGQVVQQGLFGINDSQSIQLENLPKGMYFLYLKTDKELLTKKIIVK